jgi:hypothetical protein
VRFENRPIVWRADDRAPFTEKPEPRKLHRRFMVFESSVVDPIDRALAMPEPVPALDVNALDEVPDSSWFDNRLLRGLTPEQVRAGPPADAAENLRPWRVLWKTLRRGSVGFVIEDSRRRRHLLKLDQPGFPEVMTGAGAVVQRLIWALGYHVPVDQVAVFEVSDLILAEDAFEMIAGGERPLDRARFEALLASAERDGDRLRGLTSLWLPGEPIGGHSMRGVREDDPNDVIPHQHRRELRALHTFSAWLEHTDWSESNRLDVWTRDERGGHVEHYLLDFDKALGAMAFVEPREAEGWVHSIDPGYAFLSLVSFGLWQRPWERIAMRPEEARRGVGRFESVVFDPELWRPRLPEAAFVERDRFDDFWAAKRLMLLSPDHIRAAVQAGRYSDPLAERYLFDTLLERRRKLVHHAFSRVTPLDGFGLRQTEDRAAVCFDDLWIRHGFGSRGEATYLVRRFDFEGALLEEGLAPSSDGTICTDPFPAGAPGDAYRIVQIEVLRGGESREPVEVHLARAPEGELRIIGVVRRTN